MYILRIQQALEIERYYARNINNSIIRIEMATIQAAKISLGVTSVGFSINSLAMNYVEYDQQQSFVLLESLAMLAVHIPNHLPLPRYSV
jgi:hypothetical protein